MNTHTVLHRLVDMSVQKTTLDYHSDECNVSRLLKLPSEIRNYILREAIFNGEEAITININDMGNIVLPRIMIVSKQILHETYGYIDAALEASTTRFKAQIRDYDPHPLFATIVRLSQQTGFPQNHLIDRTHVKFVGHFDLEISSAWVQLSRTQSPSQSSPL